MITAEISPELIATYKAAIYQASADTEIITLHIDQYCASLYRLLLKTGHRSAVFITAFNPRSQQQNRRKNLTSNGQLYKTLTQYSHALFNGVSSDPENKWPAEKSFLALGINLKLAKQIGQQFNQNAIVWADVAAIPRLVLLR